jgi:hypothetical protein
MMVLEIKIYPIKLRTNNFLENPRKHIKVYVTLTVRNAGYIYIYKYEGESKENLKSAIKIGNTARFSCKLTTVILMV